MILRLRHAVPWLQKFSGWSACTTPAPLARRFSGTAWTSATLAPSASDGDSQPSDAAGGSPSSGAADLGPEKKKRRSTRGAKASAAAAEAPVDSAGEADGAAASSSQDAAPKRRTSTRRKAAAGSGSGDAAEPQSAAGAADEPTAAPAPAKRTRRKKQEGPTADGDAEARQGSGAEASSSGEGGGSGEVAPAVKKRASRATSPKKTAVAAKASAVEDDDLEERVSIQSLTYEDCLVLPRKAEHILVALGLRQPHNEEDAGGAGTGGDAAASSRGGGSIGSVMELADYLGRPDPRELATPLLIAQYQGYLGPSPDYLYDLFYLDYDPPFLSSDAVRGAVVAAARSASRASGLLSAKGTPPEKLARDAMDRLRADVGEAAVAAQEARAPRLTEAQLELFLLDWASARRAGLRGEGGIRYLARRCAALQLTRPIVVERLHRYAVRGESLEGLAAASGGGRAVRLSQPMEALIEGLKAGVRLEPERLMRDFRLTSPASPVHEHLEAIRRAVVVEALSALEPGSAPYYSNLVEQLHVKPGINKALKQQEAQWKEEQGERDGSALTHAQVRLLFHLWRLERFREEEQSRRRRGAEGGAAA